MSGHKLTRREMYDLVWSKPMTKVAEGFGISDVALKKICAKHRIPTPGRGYWAKREAGRRVKPTAFRDVSDDAVRLIEIQGSRANLPKEVLEVLDRERQQRTVGARARRQAERPPPAATPPHHSAIAETAKALLRSKSDRDGVVKAVGPGLCGIVVGASSAARTIGILDGLARAVEKRGLKLEGSGDAMSIRSGGDTIKLALKEQVEWRTYVPSAEEMAAEAKRKAREDQDRLRGIWTYGQGRAYPEHYQFRTGRLFFELENHYIDGLRRTWRDGKVQILENLIDNVAVGVEAYVAGLKAQREERARRERRWAYEATLRSLQQARRQREEKRHAFVEKYERIGAELRQLQVFIPAMRMLRSADIDDEFSRMVAWTEARRRRLEQQVTIDGIANQLRAQELFPSMDPLVDPPPPVE